MKEAAGEANMTVITIVLIGVIMAVGSMLVPRLMKNTSDKSCCTENEGIMLNNKCYMSESCSIDSKTGKITSCDKELDIKC